MTDLTPRQTDIVKKIIIEYTQTGEPVGSEILDKKYNLGVSPATVRNDMMALSKAGYLKKEHFSSGRIPTAKAFRFYIQNLMKEKELSTADEVSYKSDLWDHRSELHQLLQTSTRILAKKTNLLAAAVTNEGDIYYFGVNNVLHLKEFWNIDLACDFFARLDELSFYSNILDEFGKIEDEILFLLGEENIKDQSLQETASVFGEFEGKKIKGAIGVMGPKRMHYETIVPNIKYFTGFIKSILEKEGL